MHKIKQYTIPVLVLLSGIFLSFISAYYSILGLISIFSGSVFLITLMGISLEIGKISSCIWLHKHWHDSIGFLKLYLSVAITVLMIITSLGVYGFLTKANIKQSETVTLNSAKVVSLESNIKREQSKLDLNTSQINQYNELLSKLITTDVRKASNERKRLQKQIIDLSKESKEVSKTIDNLNTQLLPFKSEINASEVDVGVLLYISKLAYGEEYKQHLPQVLALLTLLIIIVFDPLAIGLLIASQKSFKIINLENKKEYFDKVELEAKKLSEFFDKNHLTEPIDLYVKYEADDAELTKEEIEKIKEDSGVPQNLEMSKNLFDDKVKYTSTAWDNFQFSGSSNEDIRQRVEEIQEQVKKDEEIYSQLDERGIPPISQDPTFNHAMLRTMEISPQMPVEDYKSNLKLTEDELDYIKRKYLDDKIEEKWCESVTEYPEPLGDDAEVINVNTLNMDEMPCDSSEDIQERVEEIQNNIERIPKQYRQSKRN